MYLTIDGHQIQPEPKQSLRELIVALGLESSSLKDRPLAAKIAGEVFTLNYIPVREQTAASDRSSMRRAMAASGGKISLLRYGDEAGKEAYIRSANFVIFLAMRQLWPQGTVKMNCSIGSSLYLQVSGIADFSVDVLKDRVSQLVQQDICLQRRRVPLEEAKQRYLAQGETDKARLLTWRKQDYLDEYAYCEFSDCFQGEMVPSTGYLTVWDIQPAQDGFLLIYPDNANPDQVAKRPNPPTFLLFSQKESAGES